MDKKNIYIFTSKFPHSWWWVEKVSREVWYWLYDSWKFNVNFVFPWNENKTENTDWINYITIKNALKIPLLNEIFLNLKLIRIFKKLWKNDIVINNNFSPFFYLLTHKKKFKLIHICHGTMYWSSLSVKNWWLIPLKRMLNIVYARWFDLFVRYVIKRADLVITLSRYLKSELIDFYHINEDKIKIVYNWCDKNDKDILSHDRNLPLKVAFLWSNYGWKWLNILEWVAKEMHNENVHFYVVWIDSYKPQSANIISLWRLKREDVYKNMEESDIIFLPSHYEWQPLVILEWMSFWCIPVCSIHCHMDMLESSEFWKYISKNNSVDDYVKIFRSILHSSNIMDLRKLSQQVVSNYTWENQVKQYVDLISKTVSL